MANKDQKRGKDGKFVSTKKSGSQPPKKTKPSSGFTKDEVKKKLKMNIQKAERVLEKAENSEDVGELRKALKLRMQLTEAMKDLIEDEMVIDDDMWALLVVLQNMQDRLSGQGFPVTQADILRAIPQVTDESDIERQIKEEYGSEYVNTEMDKE